MKGSENIPEYLLLLNMTKYREDEQITGIIFNNKQLQNFLLSITPQEPERIEALNYILSKLKGDEDTKASYIAQMVAQTGSCTTPVKDFLTRMLLEKKIENKEQIDPALIAKIAVGDYLEKNAEKFKLTLQFEDNKKDKAEIKQAFLDALFAPAQPNAMSVLKIIEKPYHRASDGYSVGEEIVDNSWRIRDAIIAKEFAKIFCKTDKNGDPIQNNQQYIADKDKIDEIVDLYKISIGLELENKASKKALEVLEEVQNIVWSQEYNEDFVKFLQIKCKFGEKKDEQIIAIRRAIKAIASDDEKKTQSITARDVVEYFKKLQTDNKEVTAKKGDLEAGEKPSPVIKSTATRLSCFCKCQTRQK